MCNGSKCNKNIYECVWNCLYCITDKILCHNCRFYPYNVERIKNKTARVEDFNCYYKLTKTI